MGNRTAYNLISEHYQDRCAKRSGVPLINHINEGIEILHLIGADDHTIDAFCIHPLVQDDAELSKNYNYLSTIDPYIMNPKVLYLALEYRNIANAYLSHRIISSIDEIKLSPIKEVNEMLIADKVQNYKDFLIYHSATHPRSQELDEYFNNWLKRLDAEQIFRTYIELKI